MRKKKQQRETDTAKSESALERTENVSHLEQDESWVHTTIQGCEATLVQITSHTTLILRGFEEPEDAKAEQFLASYGSKDQEFVHGLLTQFAPTRLLRASRWLCNRHE